MLFNHSSRILILSIEVLQCCKITLQLQYYFHKCLCNLFSNKLCGL